MSDASPPSLGPLKPRIVVIGVGGGGGNAINNMIASGLEGPRSSALPLHIVSGRQNVHSAHNLQQL